MENEILAKNQLDRAAIIAVLKDRNTYSVSFAALMYIKKNKLQNSKSNIEESIKHVAGLFHLKDIFGYYEDQAVKWVTNYLK